MEPCEELGAMITGLRRSAALSVAAELGISEEIADAPLSIARLATRVGADAYDFAGLSTVVDVGGGDGVLLEAVLDRHEQLTGTVFDLPQALPSAPSAGASESVASRWSVMSGDFFLVVESLLDRPGRELEAALSDLNMLVMPGGRERTTEEFATLFDAAGLRLARVLETPTEVVVLEGVVKGVVGGLLEAGA